MGFVITKRKRVKSAAIKVVTLYGLGGSEKRLKHMR